MVTDIRLAVFVEIISVGSKDRIHVESIVLPPFQSQSHAQITPLMIRGRHVVGHAGTEFIDKTDLLETRRILVALDFHLKIVGQVHRDATRLAFARHGIELVGIG